MTKKHTILVADDDKDLTRSIAAYLGARGYEVVTAANGTEVMAKIQDRVPDLFVLDVMMDYDAEGLNLAHKLNQEERTRGVPIVILSGFTKELNRKHDEFAFLPDREWPAAKFFEKPVELAVLAESIKNLISETEALHKVVGSAQVV